MQIQNTSCQISTGGGFWVRIVSFTVQLSVKEKPQKHSYQSVRPVTVNVSRNVIISVSADSITILLQQGPVSCLFSKSEEKKLRLSMFCTYTCITQVAVTWVWFFH